MKVIVITNVPDGAEDLINSFDGSGLTIVSKEVESVSAIVDEAQAALEKNYSAIIVNTDSPAEANVRLNKAQGIRAYSCNNSNDVRAARKGRVNTLILSSHVTGDQRDAILDFLQGAPVRSAPAQQRPQPMPPRPAPKPKFSFRRQPEPEPEEEDEQWAPAPPPPQRAASRRPQPPPPPEPEDEEPQPEEEEPQFTSHRKGLLGKLKDSLGILDANEARNQDEEER